MIIGRELVVQLGLSEDFTNQLIQWGGVRVPTKEPIGLIGQTYLTSCEMHEVEM